MYASSWLLTVFVLAAGLAHGADAPTPVATGAEGQRAFDETAAYYNDNHRTVGYERALDDLASAETDKRASAGRYLHALLRQLLADERNGRSPFHAAPFWGGGGSMDGVELRSAVAKAIGARGQIDAATNAVLWLLEEEKRDENQVAGLQAVRHMQGPGATVILRKLLSPPHPNEKVVIGAVEEVASRGLKELAPEIERLCGHYRAKAREAAQAAAAKIGDRTPGYKPEEAFTPWLDGQLRKLARMVPVAVPKDAAWVHLVPQEDGPDAPRHAGSRDVVGWLLPETNGTLHILDWFGRELSLERKDFQVKPSSVAREAEALAASRKDDGRARLEELSSGGSLTGQFQSREVSLPEMLVAAWTYERDEKQACAALLFPRLEAVSDDRWPFWIARDLLGAACHQAMLGAFTHDRDYPRAIALARRLGDPFFADYTYQDRAKKLAAELERRTNDFQTFVLPAPGVWAEMQKKMKREEQIRFLAEHLRLLNCIQMSQPGGINYEDAQSARPLNLRDWNRDGDVINPYNELRKMHLTVAELPALVPFLADDQFILAYSYWRSFHPARELHQVNWVVAGLVNEAAKRNLADPHALVGLNEAGKKEALDRIMAWCRANAGKSREELVLATLAEAKERPEFRWAAVEAVQRKMTNALPVLVSRMPEFPESAAGEIAEVCHELDTPGVAPVARKWLAHKDAEVRFWAALILLRHGDRAKLEGLAELRACFETNDGARLRPLATADLLAVGQEEAAKLACGILDRCGADDVYELRSFSPLIQRLFLAGRQECMDFLAKHLEGEVGDEQGMTAGDCVTGIVLGWKQGRDPAWLDGETQAERAKQRKEMQTWLQEQFKLIRAGKKPAMKEPPPYRQSRWTIDAP